MMPLPLEEVEAAALLTVPGPEDSRRNSVADACIEETRLEDLLSLGWKTTSPRPVHVFLGLRMVKV